jgi:hypothetical protein
MPGTTPITFSADPGYRRVVKAMQVLRYFDRIQLGVLCDVPFGTASRILTTFENEGYVVPTGGDKREYTRAELEANPDLLGVRFNYNDRSGKESPETCKSEVMQKVDKRWPELMRRWADFLLECALEGTVDGK